MIPGVRTYEARDFGLRNSSRSQACRDIDSFAAQEHVVGDIGKGMLVLPLPVDGANLVDVELQISRCRWCPLLPSPQLEETIHIMKLGRIVIRQGFLEQPIQVWPPA